MGTLPIENLPDNGSIVLAAGSKNGTKVTIMDCHALTPVTSVETTRQNPKPDSLPMAQARDPSPPLSAP